MVKFSVGTLENYFGPQKRCFGVFFSLKFFLYIGDIIFYYYSFLSLCFIKSRAYFRFHGEIWWSQEQKEKTQTVFISEIILHSLKYALAMDFGMISNAQCIV